MYKNTEYIEVQGSKKLVLDTFSFKPYQYLHGLHCHHFLEIALVKRGRANYISNDKLYEMNVGDVYIFGNSDTHGITEIYPPDTFTITTIHFEPAFIWSQSNNLFDLTYLKIFMDRNQHFQNILDRQNPVTDEIRSLFFDIISHLFLKK